MLSSVEHEKCFITSGPCVSVHLKCTLFTTFYLTSILREFYRMEQVSYHPFKHLPNLSKKYEKYKEKKKKNKKKNTFSEPV